MGCKKRDYMKLEMRHFFRKIFQTGVPKTIGYYLKRDKRSKRNYVTIQRCHIEYGKERREDTFAYNPTISIITPLYNTKENYLKELLDSVKNQSYRKWELCLADGSDENHVYVEKICKEYAHSDTRIRYHKLKCNEGIVGNTNRCILMAQGEYYGLLDHDDVLHPTTLYECVKVINQGADFIYTDEMKFSGRIEDSTDIVCKDDFSKYELRAHNYICHFVVFKSSLLKNMDEFYRSKCEGSQDYDMVLRLTEKADKIVHIPKILYYWRVHEGSVSMDLSVKQYAVDAAKRAISDQLKRCEENGIVECNYPYETIYHLTYKIERWPSVSVIWNGDVSLRNQRRCLNRLIEHTAYSPLEIICRGNEERKLKRKDVRVKVVGGCQESGCVWSEQMVKRAEGKVLLFMDWTCIPRNSEWLKELVMYAVKPDVGVTGPFISDRRSRVISAGAMLDCQSDNGIYKLNWLRDAEEQGYEANMKHVRNVAALPIHCLMITKEKFEKVGGFDFKTDNYADADLCLRLRKTGYENIWTPFAEMKTIKNLDYWEKANLSFANKWKKSGPNLAGGEIAGYECHPLLRKLKYI